MAAVVSGMIIQCTPVSFGALGAPILVGVSTGLSGDESVASWAVGAGFVTAEGQPDMPLILKRWGGEWPSFMLCWNRDPPFSNGDRWKLVCSDPVVLLVKGLPVGHLPWWHLFSMTLPYTLVAYVLGPEFPSLLGSLAGLSFMVWCVRRGWFMPPGSSVWTFGSPAHWDSDWLGEKGGILESAPSSRPMSPLARLVSLPSGGGPFGLTRLKFLPLVSWLRSVKLEWQHILGSELGVAIEPLYLPGSPCLL